MESSEGCKLVEAFYSGERNGVEPQEMCFSICGTTLLQGSCIRSPAYQIFMLRFITVANYSY